MEKSYILFSCCFPVRSENMSSQDSEGESYVVDFIANPKSYGDVQHCSWTSEEDEDESVPPRFKKRKHGGIMPEDNKARDGE